MRALGVAALFLLLAACTPTVKSAGPAIESPHLTDEAFLASDGARLPMRAWLPQGEPRAVVVALHGFNDYRAFFDIPGPRLAAAGIAVYAYDQRGFGQAPEPGQWFGETVLQDDLDAVLRLVAARHPGRKLFVLGESMGAAVAMTALTRADADLPKLAGTILVAPAIWSRDTMPWYQAGALWVASRTVPWLTLTGRGLHIQATDNIDVLIKMSRDPLIIKATRVSAIKGLCDLMDDAMHAAPALKPPTLVLIGEQDQVVPPEASKTMAATLNPSIDVKYYPQNYHMMLRDLRGDIPTSDIIAWIEQK
ncbi:MAG TPA: lysophospholipase [Magnetospirillaceae bacterium]|nr:lysophospholipase [Magnetospirillaceae bacterium]